MSPGEWKPLFYCLFLGVPREVYEGLDFPHPPVHSGLRPTRGFRLRIDRCGVVGRVESGKFWGPEGVGTMGLGRDWSQWCN